MNQFTSNTFPMIYVYVTAVIVTFFINDPATTELYTLSLHDALPIYQGCPWNSRAEFQRAQDSPEMKQLRRILRSEEHTSELQSLRHLVCRLLLEKKKTERMESAIDYEYIREGRRRAHTRARSGDSSS